MNSRLAGIIYVVVGTIFMVIGIRNAQADDPFNWVNYLIGASAILIGIVRLRNKPPVR